MDGLRDGPSNDVFLLGDIQVSYMISAWARMCKIIGPQFVQYLPVVMGPLIQAASLKPEIAFVDCEFLWRMSISSTSFSIECMKVSGTDTSSTAIPHSRGKLSHCQPIQHKAEAHPCTCT